MKKNQLKKSFDFDSSTPFSTQKVLLTTTNPKNPIQKLSNYSKNLNPASNLHYFRPSTVIPKPRSRSNDSKPDRLYTGAIEEYSLGAILGFGAYAVVKLATHLKTQKKFAIKIYEKIKLLEPQRKKNLISEIRVLKSLNHPNIIKFHEAIDCCKQIHIVMEYVGGTSLWSCVRKRPNRVIPEQLARRYFSQIVSGMNFCHSQGIVHRDLKLENILLDSAGCVKIIDFGFGSFLRSENCRLFCGTPSYMAPEIVGKRENPGSAADVWAIGVILFVMLTGSYPFKSTSDNELYRLILKGKFEVPPSLSTPAKILLRKILNPDPRKRPTCAQILKDSWLSDLQPKNPNFPDTPFSSSSTKQLPFTSQNKENINP